MIMSDIIDELIGCHCDEAVNCVETIFRHDGCNKRIKVVSRIKAVLDIHETTTLRTTSLTPNEWSDDEK